MLFYKGQQYGCPLLHMNLCPTGIKWDVFFRLLCLPKWDKHYPDRFYWLPTKGIMGLRMWLTFSRENMDLFWSFNQTFIIFKLTDRVMTFTSRLGWMSPALHLVTYWISKINFSGRQQFLQYVITPSLKFSS